MQLLKVCVFIVQITIIGLLFSPIGTEACDGYSCASPRECCDKGCCYSWDFWVLLAGCLAIVIGICALITLCLRRSMRPCCRDTNQDRRSEPDSSGSCYAPPHYSRCSSFYQAPPPYTEVASKPDLYPLVINYAVGGCDAKSPQASYLMVQYFRNNTVQPSGSLSTTSTADSLNSCYICNMTNEADMMIPPPYSCTGSLDEFNTRTFNNTTSVATQVGETRLLRSVSTAVCNEFQFCRNRNGPVSAVMNSTESTPVNVAVQTGSYETPNTVITASCGVSHENVENTNNMTNQKHLNTVESNTTTVVHNITTLKPNESQFLKDVTNTTRNNILSQNTTNGLMQSGAHSHLTNSNSNFCNNDHILMHYSDNSAEESEQESNLPIRLSFCSKNALTKRNSDSEQLEMSTGHNTLTDFGVQIEFDIQPNLQEIQSSYSIANSINGSDISSLANLGTPDSPPRATSPTLEIRELLDKIQQLPQHRSPETEISDAIIPPDNCRMPTTRPKRYLARGITKTLYMPLKMSKHANKNKTVLSNSPKTTKRNKHWLSRSAPSTPCANFTPVFPGQRKTSSNASRRDSRTEDASPLLMKQYDISEDEQNGELL